MATSTENRPLHKSDAESEYERAGRVRSPIINRYEQQSSQNLWIYVIVALAIAAGGYLFFMNNDSTSSVTPSITQTINPAAVPPVTTQTMDLPADPPVTIAPEVGDPPVVAPVPAIEPKATP